MFSHQTLRVSPAASTSVYALWLADSRGRLLERGMRLDPAPCHRCATYSPSPTVMADTALRLARCFCTSESYWMGLRADFDA